jgi:bifunctional polynucleotide phosphatase/kinase
MTQFFKKVDNPKHEEEKKPAKMVKYTSDKQEVVLFMGAPGSGKSTFYHTNMKTYEYVNQDQLGSAAKCIKVCQAALTAGKSVVIDNNNYTKEQRSRYTSLAHEAKVPVRLFHFNTPKDRCMHNNK